MKAILFLDDAVGERRRLLATGDGAGFRLHLERWSERASHAATDEIWFARIISPLAGGRGWHIDLGTGCDGVLETSSASLHDGQIVSVRIKAEARADKGPTASLHPLPAQAMEGARPGRHAQAASDPFLVGVEVVETVEGSRAREEINQAVDEAVSRQVPVPGGGLLTLEAVTALTAIDIDAASRTGGQGKDFALDLNSAAAREASRQIALRGLAGLFVIDFVTMRDAAGRKAVAELFRQELRRLLGRRCDVLEISSLGLCEASVARRMRGAVEALAEAPEAEREALDVLRRLEDEGLASRGRRLRGRIGEAAYNWLQRDTIGWRKALGDRIGERWSLEPIAAGDGRSQVWSE